MASYPEDSFMARLYAQSQELHLMAHRLPFFKALTDKSLPVESYVSFLQGLAIIHGVLERALVENAHIPQVKPLLDDYTLKYPLLLADLDQFALAPVKSILPAVRVALGMADRILETKETSPVTLLGFLYTVEGATNGGAVLARQMKDAFGLPDEQLQFLKVYEGRVKENWARFAGKMNVLALDENEKEAVVGASRTLFEAYIALYGALYPFAESDLGFHVTTWNPEAGNHAVPTDPAEIEAAVRSAVRCWKMFPYYGIRYGERGYRFSRSDAAWLATLPALPDRELTSQSEWLAQVLAAKGMPGILLETQLWMLAEDLTAAVPGRAAHYMRLNIAADSLREKRLTALRSDAGVEIVRKLDAHPDLLHLPLLADGELLRSAIADRINGIPETENTFIGWLRRQPHENLKPLLAEL